MAYGIQVSPPETEPRLLDTMKDAKALKLPPNGEFTVEPGEVFVLGDNGQVSVDSRFWGPLETSELRARPVATIFHKSNPT